MVSVVVHPRHPADGRGVGVVGARLGAGVAPAAACRGPQGPAPTHTPLPRPAPAPRALQHGQPALLLWTLCAGPTRSGVSDLSPAPALSLYRNLNHTHKTPSQIVSAVRKFRYRCSSMRNVCDCRSTSQAPSRTPAEERDEAEAGAARAQPAGPSGAVRIAPFAQVPSRTPD